MDQRNADSVLTRENYRSLVFQLTKDRELADLLEAKFVLHEMKAKSRYAG